MAGPPYDAVVVGAGPAGSAAAALLARSGRRVLLCDRARFPRDKACGGGLTPRGVAALARLGVDTSGPAFVRVGGVELVGAGRRVHTPFPATVRWPAHGLVARRTHLDQAVLEAAVCAGAEFRPGVRVLGPLVEDGVCRGVVALQDGRRVELRAPLTLGADGATSVVARGAGLVGPPASGRGFWYAAVRAYFSGVRPRTHGGLPLLEFYPLRTPGGRWLPGYGWVFPLPDGTANVGVDLPHRPPLAGCPPLGEAYRAFVERLRREREGFAEAREEGRPVGALLPEAMCGVRPGVPGLLLLGDAAGLITPYSGEGIAYGLESAELAVAALDGGRTPSGVLEAYRRALWEAYGFQFRVGLGFMRAVRRPALARVAAAAGLWHPRVLRAAVRIMAYLIEDDPSAPSTVSRWYLAVRRLAGVRPASLWG